MGSPYIGPLILAPVEGCWVGFSPSLGPRSRELSLMSWMMLFDPMKVGISIRSASGMRGPEWEYFEDNDGTFPETFNTRSSKMSYMKFFHSKEDTLKVSFESLYMKVVRNR